MGGDFAILNPCQKKWADLEGEGRQRFCETCRTQVHAVDAYSPEEWSKLWRESEGHVCGFLAGEALAAPHSRRAILIGTMLTAVAPLWGQTGRVRIRVTDPSGTVIKTARVSLLGVNGQPVRQLEADQMGEVVWTDLPLGDSHFTVTSPGFILLRLTVTIRNANEQIVDARLEGFVGEIVPIKRRRWWQIFR